MKLKETDGSENRFGQYTAYTVRGADANPQKIHEKLFGVGQGFKYAIIFDEMPDEFEDAPKETPIYYRSDQKEENKKMINQEFFTKDEQAILRSLPSLVEWIARDADGTLCAYDGRPKRCENEFACRDSYRYLFVNIAMFKHIFKGVTWENRGGFGTTGD